jgi:hypothetical protein
VVLNGCVIWSLTLREEYYYYFIIIIGGVGLSP